MTDLQKVGERLAGIEQWQEGHKERTDDLRKCVKEIHKTVVGNGKNGLILKVDRNTRWRKTITWSIPVLIALGMLLVAAMK